MIADTASKGRGQRARRSRPLLFDRLVGLPGVGHVGTPGLLDGPPPRLQDEAALRASILGALSDLLNTRAPLPIDLLEQRLRTAVDYGIPDLSAFSLRESASMARLKRHLVEAIAIYEPRLHSPLVDIAQHAERADVMTATVQGALEKGGSRDFAITFHLLQGDDDPAAEVGIDGD